MKLNNAKSLLARTLTACANFSKFTTSVQLGTKMNYGQSHGYDGTIYVQKSLVQKCTFQTMVSGLLLKTI